MELGGEKEITLSTDLQELKASRSRPVFIWASMLVLMACAICSWVYVLLNSIEWWSPKRVENFNRFLGEIKPWPVQEGNGWGSVWSWVSDLWSSQGKRGVIITLWISIGSVVMAGFLSVVLAPLCSRILAVARPYKKINGDNLNEKSSVGWLGVRFICRLFLMLVRSIPEMILAFIAVAIFGFGPWSAIIALGLHNAGVLGRLTSELIDNADQDASKGLRMMGGRRLGIYSFGIFPEILNRFLVFFFYRWETCVREASVLGLLGIASLGFFIGEARAKFRYDEMIFFILLGSVLVITGDFLSNWVRSRISEENGK